jgi:serine protease Do
MTSLHRGIARLRRQGARALLGVVAIALLGGSGGCSRRPADRPAGEPVAAPVPVPVPAPPGPGAAPAPHPVLPPASSSAAPTVDLAAVAPPPNLSPAQRSRVTPVVEAVARAAPTVVSVLTEQRPQASPFGAYFGVEEDGEGSGGRTSLGSGVIVDPRGLVITNEHVVAGAARIRVQLSDGRELPATLIGADQAFDLAVLQADAGGKELPAMQIGTAADLMIGETAIAIGNPFGLSHTVTSGVISALHRVVQAKNRTYEDFIQTDAQINPGNSGGPLLNIHGELIGINTAVHSGGPGIGFAIPIDRARTIVSDLLQFGRVRYGWIGIRPAPLQNRRRTIGVAIAEVEPQSPAAKAGVQAGDVVTHVAGEPTQSVEQFWDRVQHVLAGDEVHLRLLRGGEVRFSAAPLDPREVAARLRKRLGLDVVDAGGRAVLVRRVSDGTIGERIGFLPGDAVLQIGTRAVRSVNEFNSALGEIRPGSDTVILVVRGQYSYYVTVPL